MLMYMAEQLFQIGVKALVRGEEGKILLVHEAKHGESWWDIPGGRMEPGEDLLQTLQRELHEEISVTEIASAKLSSVQKANKQIETENGPVDLVLVIYEVKLNSGQKPIPGEEGLELGWYEPARAAELLANKYPLDYQQEVAGL